MAGLLLAAALFATGWGPPRPASDARTVELHTPWPARIGCDRFEQIDVVADDTVDAVEWRAPGSEPLVFTLDRPENLNDQFRYFVKGSEPIRCPDEETSCILYGRRGERTHGYNAARATAAVEAGFPAGRLTTLVLRLQDVHPKPWRVLDMPYGFGAEVMLYCADPSRPSLHWVCDRRSCVARSYRDRSRGYAPFEHPLPLEPDVKDLIDTPAPALPSKRARLDAVVRALLGDMDGVLDEACAGSCSARIDVLRATAHAIADGPPLAVTHAEAKSERGNAALWPAARGFVARLEARGAGVELACIRHDQMFVPVEDRPIRHDHCRITILKRGHRLADYLPSWFQRVELPDGAVHIEGWGFGRPTGVGAIEIIGSALATDPAQPPH